MLSVRFVWSLPKQKHEGWGGRVCVGQRRSLGRESGKRQAWITVDKNLCSGAREEGKEGGGANTKESQRREEREQQNIHGKNRHPPLFFIYPSTTVPSETHCASTLWRNSVCTPLYVNVTLYCSSAEGWWKKGKRQKSPKITKVWRKRLILSRTRAASASPLSSLSPFDSLCLPLSPCTYSVAHSDVGKEDREEGQGGGRERGGQETCQSASIPLVSPPSCFPRC